MRALVLLLAAAAVAALAAPAQASPSRTATTEVVVTLEAPPLAVAVRSSRALTPRVRSRRLDLASPTSRGYLGELRGEQRIVERRLRAAVPGARVRWRYRIVADALAVVVPRNRVADLARVEGITAVYSGGAFAPSLDQSPGDIGASDLWSLPGLSTAGNGVKIGIIDTGVDPKLPFFDAAGYVYPAGFPKGDRTWTSPKVIVARGFAPPGASRSARLPYDAVNSDHGDHVAGIAAGNYGTRALPSGVLLSGVAPRAYLGNYKVFSTSTPNFGLVENSAEVIAAIEAAVRDGMDVINLSLGEYEVNPARNLVDSAIDAAADAGVVPVSAAGNYFDDWGRGSIGTPATAAKGIAVAAVSKAGRLASWSSRGPTPVSLRFKPDVSAPGVSILSSVPVREGSWASLSGTSMAAPHVAGGAALLIQQHPEWTVAKIKSALILTGRAVLEAETGVEVPANAEGGGIVDLPEANDPLVFAAPSSLSFGLVRAGTAATTKVNLSDAGGGGGSWNVVLALQSEPRGVRLTAPQSVSVPGRLEIGVSASADAEEADLTGFVILQRDDVTRRIPFWTRIERPQLGEPSRVLTRAGRYSGDTRRGRARVVSYRYPDDPTGMGVTNTLPGPEQVFRMTLGKRVANFGVRVVSQAKDVFVSPRIVRAGDENRLAGVASLPLDLNPYRDSFGQARPVSAALVPSPGEYDIVFDTVSLARAGPFAFRLWMNDTTPPLAKLVTQATYRVGGDLVVRSSDAGSGVDPRSIRAWIDGRRAPVQIAGAKAKVQLGFTLKQGRHTLVFQVSDFQELKNSESTLGVLPNTTVLRTSFRIR